MPNISNVEVHGLKRAICTAGFELTAVMTTNYQQFKTIYQQRRHHLLPDWQMFCDWCLTLPLFKELCIDRNN